MTVGKPSIRGLPHTIVWAAAESSHTMGEITGIQHTNYNGLLTQPVTTTGPSAGETGAISIVQTKLIKLETAGGRPRSLLLLARAAPYPPRVRARTWLYNGNPPREERARSATSARVR